MICVWKEHEVRRWNTPLCTIYGWDHGLRAAFVHKRNLHDITLLLLPVGASFQVGGDVKSCYIQDRLASAVQTAVQTDKGPRYTTLSL